MHCISYATIIYMVQQKSISLRFLAVSQQLLGISQRNFTDTFSRPVYTHNRISLQSFKVIRITWIFKCSKTHARKSHAVRVPRKYGF